MKSNMQKAREIAEKTRDAYSYNRYNSFTACANALLKLGYDERETEAILRSKWMRWAADAADRGTGATVQDLLRWLEVSKTTKTDVRKLTEETFAA